jgi:hypothetical protein
MSALDRLSLHGWLPQVLRRKSNTMT